MATLSRLVSVSMCSSIWVTRMISSIVVSPALTLFQPSVRSVRIPPSRARWAMVVAGARLKISGRIASETRSSS